MAHCLSIIVYIFIGKIIKEIISPPSRAKPSVWLACKMVVNSLNFDLLCEQVSFQKHNAWLLSEVREQTDLLWLRSFQH